MSEVMTTDADVASFAALYHDHYAAVCRYVSARVERDAVEDIAAETFTVAWRRREVVPGHALPWLLNTASKCAANHRRSGDRRRALLEQIIPCAPTSGSPDEAARQRAERRALVDALADLDPQSRELVLLRHWDGLKPREIAVVVGIGAVAARARLSRAQRRLQLRLDAGLAAEGLAPMARLEPHPQKGH
jgi:RNA polymerase sigma factor (sigma-70 family)